MATRTLRCNIEDLADGYPRLFLDPYIVACVAVLRRYSGSPASFEVECEGIESNWIGEAERFQLEVSWTEETAAKALRLQATMPTTQVVEFGSVALAFVLARRVLNLRRLTVTIRGQAADYLAPKVARVLEVSGTESLAELDRRHREKVQQALRNPFNWDAYVVVCGFGTCGHHIRFSAHSWEELADAQDEG